MRISDWSSDVCSSDLVDLAFDADDTRFWHVDQRGQGAQQVRRRDPERKQLLDGRGVIERRLRQINQPVGERNLKHAIIGEHRLLADGIEFIQVHRARRWATSAGSAAGETKKGNGYIRG